MDKSFQTCPLLDFTLSRGLDLMTFECQPKLLLH